MGVAGAAPCVGSGHFLPPGFYLFSYTCATETSVPVNRPAAASHGCVKQRKEPPNHIPVASWSLQKLRIVRILRWYLCTSLVSPCPAPLWSTNRSWFRLRERFGFIKDVRGAVSGGATRTGCFLISRYLPGTLCLVLHQIIFYLVLFL